MRILVMGGTRFIGVYLTQSLVEQGHDVVLFNRGNCQPPVSGLTQIHGDRTNAEQLTSLLKSESSDVIFDNNGRELSDTKPSWIYLGTNSAILFMSVPPESMPPPMKCPTPKKIR